MMRKILIGSAVLVSALAMVMVVQPPTFHVERSVVVHASAEQVHALVNDFRAWRQWSPFENKDPSMKRSYGGAESGVGATYAWSSEGGMGEGKMTMLASSVRNVRIELAMSKPMRATHSLSFSFIPGGDRTRVTWATDGENTLPSKLAHLFFDLDQSLGAEFERGLTKLKTAAERPAVVGAQTANLK